MNKYIKMFFRAINAGKTPHKNEDQSVAGMFCLNVSKLTQESDGDGSPTHVTQVCMSVWSNLKFHHFQLYSLNYIIPRISF